MNIVFTVFAYWPSCGGVQEVTQYLAEGLAKKGHNVIVLTKSFSINKKVEYHNGVKIIRFNCRNIFLSLNIGEKKEFRNFLLKNDIDCLITVCADTFNTQWVYPIIDKIKCKKIMYMHGLMYNGLTNPKSKPILRRLPYYWWLLYYEKSIKYIKKYNACIHIFKNDSSYNWFFKKGFKSNYVVMNSCDDRFFEEKNMHVLNKYNLTNRYFLCVANYIDRKNQKFLVSEYLKNKNHDVHLVMIGSEANEYYLELLNQIGENTNKIHALVNLNRDDTIEIIKNAYSIVISSKSEYFPVVIVEAMACGVPFISTDVGIVKNLMLMSGGGIVVDDKNGLNDLMNKLEKNCVLAKKLGQQGKEFARKNLKKEIIISKVEEIISNV